MSRGLKNLFSSEVQIDTMEVGVRSLKKLRVPNSRLSLEVTRMGRAGVEGNWNC